MLGSQFSWQVVGAYGFDTTCGYQLPRAGRRL